MPEIKDIQIPEVPGYEDKKSELLEAADNLQVVTEEDAAVGSRIRKSIAEIRHNIAVIYDPLIQQAHGLHKSMLAAKAEHDKPLGERDRKVQRSMEAYYDDIERKRREAEEKARIAREKAEKEKQDEEDRLAREAEEAEEAGDSEKAEELIEQATTVEAPVPEPTPMMPARPQIEGSSARRIWAADVVDFMALAKAVAEGRAPEKSLIPDQKFLDARARADKEDMKIPGVEARSRASVARA